MSGLPASGSLDKTTDLIAYLRDAENQDLYLVNLSDQKGKKRRTELVFNVRDSGGSHSIVIPDTFLPINVGIRVESLSAFARSESFLRLVNLRYVKALDSDAALEFLSTPDAVAEQSRLYDDTDSSAAFNITDDSVAADSAKSAREQNRSSANPKVVAIMQNATMDENKQHAALRNIQSEIGPGEIEYIMQHAKSERVKGFARNLTTGS